MRRWLACLALLACMAPVQAELRLQLDDEGLSAAERQASQQLLEDARQALPPTFRQRLDRSVEVRWDADLPAQSYGQSNGRQRLLLNRRLLPGLVSGELALQRTERSHGTQQRELLATVLHELLHLYDRARLWSPEQKTLLARCRLQSETAGKVGLPGECRSQDQRRFTLSDEPRLLDLAGWPQQVGRRGTREAGNAFVDRSPDDYELSNPREFVAVNFEYFLLDPQYACRRPALQRFYREHFAWQPAEQAPCAPQQVYLNAGSDFRRQPLGRLDPERIYEVDYLFAEANANWVSRWGHSMLRLVICAPGRPRGPDCRLDLDEHLVLSYRAFVGDVQLSTWDGLTGAYPSRLFILPLGQVVDEYTKVELRSLASVPLRLSRAQIDQLAVQAAQAHWSYDGRYYFFSNNCAVETLKLLRAGTDHPQLRDLDSIMPNGLLALLEGRGIANRTPLQDPREALRLGYRFDSFRERFQAMFKVLKAQLAVPQDEVEDWLALPARERRPWFAQADLRSSAALLLLEQAAQRRQLLLAQEELKQRYLAAREGRSGERLDSADSTLRQILGNSGFLSRPAELLPAGYGLPQPDEWAVLEAQSRERQGRLRQLSDHLDEEIRRLLAPQRLAELEAGEANTQALAARLHQLHRAKGGIVLPWAAPSGS